MLVARRRAPYIMALVMLLGAGMMNVWSGANEQGRKIIFDPLPLPARMSGWAYVREQKADQAVHDMLQEDAMQWRAYRKGAQWADVLVLYGHRKRTFHLPDSCLAGAGISIKSRQVIALTMPDGSVVPFHALTLSKDDISRVALYTFVGPGGNPTDLLGLNIGMLICRVRGRGPKGAAVRVIGPLDPQRPLATQPVCDLALCALKEACKRVEHAGPARDRRRADTGRTQWPTC